jgi:phosphatidyl-myo-inositol dimannoside synthase
MSAPSPTERPLRLLALFPQLLGHGGVQEAGRQMALALDELSRRHGFATEFLSLNDSRTIHSFALGGHEISIRAFGRSKFSFVLAVLRATRSLDARGPRLVLAFHPNLVPPASWAVILSPGTKLAVVAHGVDAWQPLPASRRRALRGADLAIAPSQFTCEQLHTVQGVARKKIRLLPWALPPEVLCVVESPEKATPPPGFPQGRVVLAVGRWAASERYKGADDLILAVAQLRTSIPDLQLVLVGDGDDLLRLQQLAKTTGASAGIHFLGGISNEALAACYSHAEIFALPSSGEGFGFVFLEAMAFGKPIVAAAAGGATDLVRHEVNGLLVPPGDWQQLVQALARLLGDDRLREQLGKRGKEIAQEEFTFSSFTTRLEALLREASLLT